MISVNTSIFKWPEFTWSHDDKFFARSGKDIISVYEVQHNQWKRFLSNILQKRLKRWDFSIRRV